VRFRTWFVSPYDVDECQRRIWLLNETTVAVTNKGAVTCFARAHADDAGFAVWTMNVAYAGGVGESSLAVHGRWRSDAAGTRIEARYFPRPMFGVSILAVLGGGVLLGSLAAASPSTYRRTVGDLGPLLVGGALIAAVILVIVAASELRDLKLKCLIEEALCAPEKPPPRRADAARSRRSRRRR
jgi:hypothetical protein